MDKINNICLFYLHKSLFFEKKEEIWFSPVTKTPSPTEQSKKQMWQHKNATKNFDYTTIADRLRTVSWSNSSHPTGVVKPVYERSTFPLTATAVNPKCSKMEYLSRDVSNFLTCCFSLFDYTTITDRLVTVSRSDSSNPTGWNKHWNPC